MNEFSQYEIWFITGSQHLYGSETLKQVAADAKRIVRHLDDSSDIPLKIVWKPTVTTPDEVSRIMQEANYDAKCAGVICWMHTFSPAKMWIGGLNLLSKPMLHLHTQFNRELPWPGIDMDFMNLNQSAHGDREFGFICTRMGMRRKVVAGFWQDGAVKLQIGQWCRAAAGRADALTMKIARFGDNMREVAVTEGNKVSAQMQFGYAVNGYGVGELVNFVNQVDDAQIDNLVSEYRDQYLIPNQNRSATASIREAARIEIGLRAFLEDGGFKGFTTTFEDLHGLCQLPGLAAQRLMADGYGFGAEGDWTTAALTRTMKVMASGLNGGTSFMEDYTYHLENGNELVLGAHMLEVCPTIAANKPSLEVHPLGIGGKDAPARLVFNSAAGPAVNASLIDLGSHFRLIVNEVDAVMPDVQLPSLPVARVVWKPLPDLQTAAAAWIYAGGAHHTVYSQAVTTAMLEDFAEIAGIELIVIDRDTRLRQFKKELNNSCLPVIRS